MKDSFLPYTMRGLSMAQQTVNAKRMRASEPLTREDELRQIEEYVAAGKVRRIPIGVSSETNDSPYNMLFGRTKAHIAKRARAAKKAAIVTLARTNAKKKAKAG